MKVPITCDVLNGVLLTDGQAFWSTLSWGRCANPRCGRVYLPRADGDVYCCNACDLDDNPNLRA